MSKKRNNWFILGTTLELTSRGFRPRLWQIGLWLLLIVLLFVAFQSGALDRLPTQMESPAFPLVTAFGGAALFMLVMLVWSRSRRAAVRADYLRALKQPGPGPLIDVVARAIRPALPQADAFGAQSRALAYALYGHGNEAARALSNVDWASKAAVIQAVGLSAEGVVELLCRRDAARALELNRKARSLAELSAAVPGSVHTRRYHGVCVALSEAALDTLSPASRKWLDEVSADARFAPLQLLACLGLAWVHARAGDAERAGRLRAFLLETAPHCAPLQLEAKDFAVPAPELGVALPVAAALAPTGGAAGEAPDRQAKRRLLRLVAIVVGLWVAFIAAYLALGGAPGPGQ